MPSRLYKHAQAFRFNGIPVYGEEGEITGWVREPEWKIEDLTPKEEIELGRHVFAALDERDEKGIALSDAQVYRLVLEQYGIACPHLFPFPLTRVGAWGECRACGMRVLIIKERGENQR